MAVKSKSKTKKEAASLSLNAFAGQAECPTAKAVDAALGTSCVLWKQLVAELKRDLKLDAEDWHSSGVKYGWALRLQLKKRNIVYLSPRFGSFVVTFVIGDKAVAAAKKSDLPAHLIKRISEAKRYPEGTPVRIEVSEPKDLEPIKPIAKIKLEN